MSLLCSVPPEKPSVFSRELTDTTVTEGEELTLVCEITTLDEKLYLQVFARPDAPATRRAAKH